MKVKRPFDVEPIVCAVPLVDILEAAASFTVQMCQLRRQMEAARQ